ncbi:hypothetical protein BH23BAC3_BH23BAC3_07850 [soil metagenome]
MVSWAALLSLFDFLFTRVIRITIVTNELQILFRTVKK